jgi:Ca-activated chloride channel homolog
MTGFLRRIQGALLFSAFLIGIGIAGSLTDAAEAKQESTPQGLQDESFKIKVDVDLVTTDVTVIGKATSQLRAEDFLIYDNNVAQQVSHFSQDQLPLAVAILVDGSASIQPYLPVLQIAAVSALRRLKPEDQAVLFSFASNASRLSDLTEDRFLIAEKIGKMKISNGTNIFGTVYEASRYLSKKAPRRRRAIILVSDNCHNVYSSYKADNCRAQLLETATTLYNIRTPGDTPGFWGGGCSQAHADIRMLAEETGGQVLDVRDPTSMQAALEKAITDLRMQYTIGFNPPSPEKTKTFHRLTVKLSAEDRCPGCRLLGRSGYYAGVAAPLPPPEELQAAPRRTPEKTDQLLIQQIIMSAGTVDVDLPGIPFAVSTAEQTGPGGEKLLKVDMQINLSGITFINVENRHNCRLRVAVFYATEKGKILGSDWRMIEGALSEETYARVIKTGILFSTMIPVKEKKQMLKVVVYDVESDKVGSKLILLQ